jgi:hypothetical protein
MDLETPEQITARRAAHRAAWQTVPCATCGAPINSPCLWLRGVEMLAGLAHANRIWVASVQLWPKEIFRRK